MTPLSIAIGNYGVSRAVKDGEVTAEGLALDFATVEPITAAMRRMVRTLDFDVCEMAFATYLCAKAAGVPITAIPVFLTRNFHHWAAFYNVHAGIRQPKDIEGRRVGVNRGYTVTTGVWVRGILRSEYDVDLDSITWLPTDEEHVSPYHPPANVDYANRGKPIGDLLLSRAVDAAVGDVRVTSPDVQPLIPDARNAGFAYYRKTGIYPLNHGLVIRNATLAARPGAAAALFAAFKAAKARYLDRLVAGGALSAADEAAAALGKVVGDPFPFGVNANRLALEAFVGFAAQQKVIPQRYSIDDLFAAETLALT